MRFRPTALARRAVGLAVVAGAGVLSLLGLAGCCWCDPQIAEGEAFQQVDSPRTAYALLRQAVGCNQKDLFYYLLAADVRREYPLSLVRNGWAAIRFRFGSMVRFSRVLRVEYLAESPFPPRPAARVVVEYPPDDRFDSDAEWVVESFLVVLESAPGEYGEVFPQWRIYYPYEPYLRR
ncbi:MAG: hypothetical protein AB7S36_10725 [Planctomycetota bacterium]